MNASFSRTMLGAAVAIGFAAAPALAQSNDAPATNTKAPVNAPNGTSTASSSVAGNDTTSKVTQDGYLRSSKLIGSDVYNSADTAIGTLDDVLLSEHEKAATAVVSVGGFLGIGSKLVEVPFSKLKINKAGHLVLAGATKDSLTKLHAYQYDK